MNTVEKTSTGVTPAQLILNNSVRLSDPRVTEGHAPSGHNLAFGSGCPLGSHGRMDLKADRLDHGSAGQAIVNGLPRSRRIRSGHNGVPGQLLRVIHPSSRQFLPRHRGPYQVMEKTTSIYTKKFDDPYPQPEASIRGHRGDRSKQSSIEFKVH